MNEEQNKQYKITVNEIDYVIADEKISGREIIEMATIESPSEFVVVQECLDGRLETIGLKEKIKLDERINIFLMFKSDRIFRLLINENDFDWPCPIITGCTIKHLSKFNPEEAEVMLEKHNEPDIKVNDSDKIDLEPSGVERFIVKKISQNQVQIKVNNKPVTLLAGSYTGLELKSIAIDQKVEIEQSFVLSQTSDNCESMIVGDTDQVQITGNENFRAIPDDESS